MKKENKILFKYFVFAFLATALIVNWQGISWLFNDKVISGFISGIFDSKSIASEGIQPENHEMLSQDNRLEIPKIGISVPLIVLPKATQKDLPGLLDQGAVYYPGSSLPGQTGETVILGHSAPLQWPQIKHDWIFSRISELNRGDEISVYYNGQKYVFYVSGKFFLDRGEELPATLTNSKNVVVLISCWPPGKDIKRIAVTAE
jgi:LPXTG-site transpeptidase (sortase) family protein